MSAGWERRREVEGEGARKVEGGRVGVKGRGRGLTILQDSGREEKTLSEGEREKEGDGEGERVRERAQGESGEE
eukprot:762845-Hanusia_phi.AAC.2